MVVSGMATVVALKFIDAPYGKFAPDGKSVWGPLVPARWAWVIQESPALIAMIICWCMAASSSYPIPLSSKVLGALFCFHYVVRAWVFPFLLRASKPVPLSVMLLAFVFCVWNGTLQGHALFMQHMHGKHSHDDKEWLHQARVQVGILLFIIGWLANQHADHVLRQLRRRGEAEREADAQAKRDGSSPTHSRYKVPYGGLFRYVSAANYAGEVIEWFGWALAAGSFPAFAFAIFTFSNLAPRAISYHRWYQQHFPNYPKERKAIIPFVL